MKISQRRLVFLVEFIVIVLPYTLFIGIGAFGIIAPSFSFGLTDLLISLLMTSIALVPFACGFRLSL
ncbi:MAG: hypothetical protein HW392_55, partial [Steroidobacteraceae bacterium]|nr:hypothetical protein [Steroidobacteraceae bacterium]